MRLAIKVLVGLAIALVIGVSVTFAAAGRGDDKPQFAATTTGTTTDATDVRGPCDEPEHANDPRCAAPQQPENDARDHRENTVEDVSGPCDEAEHADDPRCTPGSPAAVGDDRGRGDDSDRSGHSHGNSSGPGPSGGDAARAGDNRGRDDEHEDVRGPCDEAEHANDPRCGRPAQVAALTPPPRDDDAADRSGPSAPSGNSGPGGREDRSGPSGNSGSSGSGSGGSGSSGHSGSGGDSD